MGRITSNIGLVTGVPITETVDQLIALEAVPRNQLAERTKTLDKRQQAITDLTAQILSLQFDTRNLGNEGLFNQTRATSSNSSALSVSVTGQPQQGSHVFTPIRTATRQQLLSTSFVDDASPIGAGRFSFTHGPSVDPGASLQLLNEGRGVQRGKIRITDRAGKNAEVDLRFARSVDDVLAAVNSTSEIDVRLETVDGRFRLVDLSGQTTANLRVDNLGGTTTATDLGLGGLNVAANVADGQEVMRLFRSLSLAELNDGLGVGFDPGLADLEFTFRDGSDPLSIDFQSLGREPQKATGTRIAANGISAQLRFTAVASGGQFDGTRVQFVDDANITAGNEVVTYDEQAGTLTFRIDEAATTADDVIAALESDPVASTRFTAERVAQDLFATATTGAAAGPRAELTFTARRPGPSLDGFTVRFVDDAAPGAESIDYDFNAGTIVYHIAEGVTTAEDLKTLSAAHASLSLDFDVGTGTFFAGTTTQAAGGTDAEVNFTALNAGAALNNVQIVFEDDPGVQQGNETVALDTSGGNKRLVFQIDAGNTTAQDIVAAVAADEQVSSLFAAELTAGSSGQGVIDIGDTATTSGGLADGLVSAADTATTSGGAPGLVSTQDEIVLRGGAGTEVGNQRTLGDLLDTLNQDGRLLAQIAADGRSLTFSDLTDDLGGSFSVGGPLSTTALSSLHLDTPAEDGVLTSGTLLGGLKTSLLSSLDGGQGLSLGTVHLADRTGAAVDVDLSSTDTLDDVIEAINAQAAASGVGIAVGVNATGNGLLVVDTTGAASGNLVVADSGDGTLTATKLGIAVDDHVATFSGSNLHRQAINENTSLDELNAARGIRRGTIRVTNSDGLATSVSIDESVNTVGDLVKAINARAIDVTASINAAGDGITLTDTAGGAGNLTVANVGFGATATDLQLTGEAEKIDVHGETHQVLRGGGIRFDIDIGEQDTLDDLIGKINAAAGGISAGKIGDGSVGNPFRLTLLSNRSGAEANVTFETDNAGFSLQQTTAGRDALLLSGFVDDIGSGILLASADGVFQDAIAGVDLTVNQTSPVPVTVDVQTSDNELVVGVEGFVNRFNKLRDKLDELTFVDVDANTAGPLAGSFEALRIEAEILPLITGRLFGVGEIRTLQTLGVSINDQGKLSLDTAKLRAAYRNDPESVEKFFSDEDNGLSAKLDAVLERLVGEENSLLVNKAQGLADQINSNVERIESLDTRLRRRREALLKEFVNMELVIGRLQSNLTALDGLQALEPLSINLNR